MNITVPVLSVKPPAPPDEPPNVSAELPGAAITLPVSPDPPVDPPDMPDEPPQDEHVLEVLVLMLQALVLRLLTPDDDADDELGSGMCFLAGEDPGTGEEEAMPAKLSPLELILMVVPVKIKRHTLKYIITNLYSSRWCSFDKLEKNHFLYVGEADVQFSLSLLELLTVFPVDTDRR